MFLDLSILLVTHLSSLWHRLVSRAHRGWHRPDGGQATAEYALVLLGAAVVAIALVTWATQSGRIGQLFDAVFDQLQSRL